MLQNVAPLKGGFMITSMVGFLISAIYVYDISPRWGFTFALFFALMLPLLPYYLSGEGNARYKLVSITDDPGLIPRINERRGLSTLSEPLPRVVHNKVTYISAYFLQHYFAHFTPEFLFVLPPRELLTTNGASLLCSYHQHRSTIVQVNQK